MLPNITQHNGCSCKLGIFQTYYETQYPETSASVISLIGSLQAAMIEGTGMMVGVLMEKFGLKRLMICGAILQLGALLATSFCTAIWQLYLTQGLAFGIGAGTLYIAAVSVPGQWFHRRKATAYGALYTSSGLGGVIWPIAIANLLPKVGYGWTLRIIMFVSLVQIVFGLFFVKERDISKRQETSSAPHEVIIDQTEIIDMSPRITNNTISSRQQTTMQVYQDKKLWYIATGYFILAVGMLSPMYFVGTFAKTIGMSDHLAFYLLAMLNAASIPGRTLTGVLADRYGRLNILILSILGAAIVQLVMWTTITTNAELILFVIFYGFVFGGLISLMPAVSAQVLGQNQLATKFGVVSALGGFGSLMGAPVSAIWIGKTRESYYGTILFSGGFVFVSAIWYTALRLHLDRRIWVRV